MVLELGRMSENFFLCKVQKCQKMTWPKFFDTFVISKQKKGSDLNNFLGYLKKIQIQKLKSQNFEISFDFSQIDSESYLG